LLIDLRQLEYVVAVADAGGFIAGARAAHVSQPALSARIADLERELGVELFHRVGRGSKLSSAGEVVTEHARVVLRDILTLKAGAAAVAGLSGGTLDVAALPTLAVDPLAELVGSFRAAHPKVIVRIADAEDDGVAAMVRAGRVELGLSDLPITSGGLIEVPLADQELLAITNVGRRSRDLRALAAQPLVLTPPGTSSRRVVEAALAALGIEPIIAVEVAQREAVVPLVLAGAGIGFVPRAQAEAARAQGATVVRPDPPLVRRIGVVHRPGPQSPAAGEFLRLGTRSDR
jgi:LysR family carnitine catabolism transcriptional activator